jgi:hypothetical protein
VDSEPDPGEDHVNGSENADLREKREPIPPDRPQFFPGPFQIVRPSDRQGPVERPEL